MTQIPEAACKKCGGWTSFGGMAQYSQTITPILGRVGCICQTQEYAVRFHFEPDHHMGKCVEFVKAQSPDEARAKFLKSAQKEIKIDSITPRNKEIQP